MVLASLINDLFGVLLSSGSDEAEGSNSDNEEASSSDDDIQMAGIEAVGSEPSAEQQISDKIAAIRAAKQAMYTPNEARRKGGNRTADLELMNRNLFNERNLEASTTRGCACGDHCCGWFDLEDVRAIRAQTYGWLPNTERTEEVVKDIVSRMQYDPETEVTTLHYFLNRREVCQDAYFHLRYGLISPSTKQRVLGFLERGLTHWESEAKDKHMRIVNKPGGLKRDQVRTDILCLAHSFGDQQPDDIAGPDAIQIDLDPGITKGLMYYQDYLDKCDEEHTDPCKYSYFIAIWNSSFGKKSDVAVCYNHDGDNPQLVPRQYVLILRDESKKKRFHDCKTCSGDKSELAACKPEETAKKAALRKRRRKHFVTEVKVEKQLYYGRRAEGKETMRLPHGGALSIIMDGEDKSSHQYPHQPRVNEAVEKLERLTLKVPQAMLLPCVSCNATLIQHHHSPRVNGCNQSPLTPPFAGSRGLGPWFDALLVHHSTLAW